MKFYEFKFRCKYVNFPRLGYFSPGVSMEMHILLIIRIAKAVHHFIEAFMQAKHVQIYRSSYQRCRRCS